MRRLAAIAIIVLLGHSQPAAGQADPYVPELLEPWRDWVLDGAGYRDCPLLLAGAGNGAGDFVCGWPGVLEMYVRADGASFTQRFAAYDDAQWLPLPGNTALWPLGVTINGERASVVERAGAPTVLVDAGDYVVRGEFRWQERPATIPVPDQTGLVALTLDGQRIANPERNPRGIWLGERRPSAQSRDALEVEVYRLVRDDIPGYLVTRLLIDVSGSVREADIGKVLPSGYTPLQLTSELPARVEPDGSLTLQVRPGYWETDLVARADGVIDALTMPAPEGAMPTTEIWSYARNDSLRITVPEGLPPIDPVQADVPGDWETLPAFRAQPGDRLTITERSRGKTAVDNQLALTRQLWLNFDGSGFVFSDDIAGNMRSGWRLDMAAPYRLISASSDDNLLVTRGDDPALTGVEIRESGLALEAAGLLSTRGTIPVTGWQARFDEVRAELFLPPGTRLLTAVGVDRADGSWTGGWRLLDFFLVLVTAVASYRLFGAAVGVLALVTLLLSLHEPWAPAFVWLNLLIATALVRLAPAGGLLRASKVYRALSLVVLLGLFVPYAATQLRAAIYPQLADTLRYAPATFASVSPESPPPAARAPAQEMADQGVEEIIVTASRVKRFERYAPDTVVAVGPGLPEWTANAYRLRWAGPVSAEQTMRLVVLPRPLVSLLRIITVLLIAALAAVFVYEAANRRWPWRPRSAQNKPGGAAALWLIGVVGLGVLQAPPAAAQMPSAEQLEELRQRLLAPPACAPSCADIATADVTVGAAALQMRLGLHALEDVAVPIPGSLNGWQPQQIQIDGRPSDALLLRNGQFWLLVPAAARSVTLSGSLPDTVSVEIPFPRAPKRITVQTDESWLVSGVERARLTSGSLQLNRQQLAGDGSAARWERSRLPTFVQVERNVTMALDWTVTTRVQRLAPDQGAISIAIPLLDGERVTSEGTTVRDDAVVVAMPTGARTVSWTSRLPAVDAMTLTAAASDDYTEVWRFDIGALWNVAFSGVPESGGSAGTGDARVATFRPRAGELLTLAVARPPAIDGATLTFDAVAVSTEVGQRTRNTTLQLDYRSTRGAQHVITLPADARVGGVTIDGEPSPLRAEDGRLTVPILPGSHDIGIIFESERPVGWATRTPPLDLGAEATNVVLQTEMPSDRWVLLTSGPTLGPAVLYWSELAVLILFAWILGRIPLTPLGTTQWLLLGIGFSMISWPALVIIGGWLLAMGAKEKIAGKLDDMRYNGVQLLLGLLAVLALANIVIGLPRGLLGRPDMSVIGNGSYGNLLRWYADHVAAVLPDTTVYSLPMWCYKALILVWALWLSFALLRWLPWAWQRFSDGGLWRKRTQVRESVR